MYLKEDLEHNEAKENNEKNQDEDEVDEDDIFSSRSQDEADIDNSDEDPDYIPNQPDSKRMGMKLDEETKRYQEVMILPNKMNIC